MTHHRVEVQFDEREVDSLFSEVDQCQLPGAAVGIAIGGRPVYRKGFGLASMELPVLLSPSTRMRIYSTTKHFTCLAYLLLCEERKAQIDDPIVKHLPELHPVTHRVTMRQLMGNVGGLRNAHDINWQFSGTGRPISSEDLLSLYRDIDDVNFAPGTAWCYNNGGFLILSCAIERITGQSLERVLRERIFEPVGMHDTLLRRVDTDFVPHSATLHMTHPEGGYDRSYIGTASAGEGGIVSTVDDMLRWLAHMSAPRVGSDSTWAMMKTPQILANGTSTNYGLGLFTREYRGIETLCHAGGGPGGNAQMLKVPALGLDIVIMVNRQDMIGEELANRILDVCVTGLTSSPEEIAAGSPVWGVFRSPKSGRVVQLRAGRANPPWIKEGQQVATVDGIDIPMEVIAENLLRPCRVADWMKLQLVLIGEPENPTSVRLTDFGRVDELVRVPSASSDIGSIVGRYRSDSTHTEATICPAAEGARLVTIGRFGSAEFRLEHVAERIWAAKAFSPLPWLGGILSFDSDGEEFRFSNTTTRLLPFRRVG